MVNIQILESVNHRAFKAMNEPSLTNVESWNHCKHGILYETQTEWQTLTPQCNLDTFFNLSQRDSAILKISHK